MKTLKVALRMVFYGLFLLLTSKIVDFTTMVCIGFALVLGQLDEMEKNNADYK